MSEFNISIIFYNLIPLIEILSLHFINYDEMNFIDDSTHNETVSNYITIHLLSTIFLF